MPAGTPHSFGPDTLVYEIEQSSDIQQHVMHWDMQDGSPVPDEEFATNLDMFMREVKTGPKPDFGPGLALRAGDAVERVFLTAGPYFALERWHAGTAEPLRHSVATAQILSNLGAPVRVRAGDRSAELGRAETMLLPAALGTAWPVLPRAGGSAVFVMCASLRVEWAVRRETRMLIATVAWSRPRTV